MTAYQALQEALPLMAAQPGALCWLRLSGRPEAEWTLLALEHRRDLATIGPYALQHESGARLVLVFGNEPATPEVTRVWSVLHEARPQSRDLPAQKPQRPPSMDAANRELL